MQKKITFRCAFLSSQADIFASLKQCHFLFEIQNNFYLMLKCSHTFINVLTDFFFVRHECWELKIIVETGHASVQKMVGN